MHATLYIAVSCCLLIVLWEILFFWIVNILVCCYCWCCCVAFFCNDFIIWWRHFAWNKNEKKNTTQIITNCLYIGIEVKWSRFFFKYLFINTWAFHFLTCVSLSLRASPNCIFTQKKFEKVLICNHKKMRFQFDFFSSLFFWMWIVWCFLVFLLFSFFVDSLNTILITIESRAGMSIFNEIVLEWIASPSSQLRTKKTKKFRERSFQSLQ